MTIGLICAIPQEIVHLSEALAHRHTHEAGGARFDQGTLDGHDVVVVGAGIGKVNAAMVATVLADHFDARAIVFSGVAGGLDPDLHIGDVVVAARAIQHDCGTIENGALQPYQAGHIAFFNPTDRLGFTPAQPLLERVRAALADLVLEPLTDAAGGTGRPPRIVFGTVLTGDQFINCEATRKRLHAQFDAQAGEMEGAAVAQVAESFDRDWLLVRALSDLAGAESHFDFGRFVEEVAASSALIVRRCLPVL